MGWLGVGKEVRIATTNIMVVHLSLSLFWCQYNTGEFQGPTNTSG